MKTRKTIGRDRKTITEDDHGGRGGGGVWEDEKGKGINVERKKQENYSRNEKVKENNRKNKESDKENVY